MKHHTKEKGDLGVFKVEADLASKGFVILRPMSEHTPFDVVAYKRGKFIRIQVKFRTKKNGVLTVGLWSYWSNKNGYHVKKSNGKNIDIVAVYCPDTDCCYYLKAARVASVKNLILRIDPAKNNQRKLILWASSFIKLV